MKTIYSFVRVSILAAALVTGLTVSGCSGEQTKDKPMDVKTQNEQNDLRSTLEARIQDKRSVGYAVGTIDDNGPRIFGVGMADKEKGLSVNETTIFEIGSITKVFTGLVLADMVIKGEVSLDDPASKYLPENVTMPRFKDKDITLLDLATHTSALPRMPGNFMPADPSNPYADYTVDQMYAFLSSLKLDREIGGRAEYSNLGMGLLGHILALKDEASYEELIRNRVLNPLDMDNTFITIPEAKMADFATGYSLTLEPVSHWDLATLSGAGAIRSDSVDMMKFLKANMGLIETPLSDAITLSHIFQHEFGSKDTSIGLAWITDKTNDSTIIWHNGGTGGFRTFLGFDPDKKRGAFIFGNAQDEATMIGKAIISGDISSVAPEVEDKSLVFTDDDLKRFDGDYQLAPEFIITVRHKDGRVFAQATGQGEFELFARSKTEFFLKVVEASVKFNEGENGDIISLTLDQNGVQQPAKKIK